MASKKRSFHREFDLDPYDDLDYDDEDDIEMGDIARDFFSTEYDGDSEAEKRISARRQIERRKEMKNLYSELDDWQEFGQYED